MTQPYTDPNTLLNAPAESESPPPLDQFRRVPLCEVQRGDLVYLFSQFWRMTRIKRLRDERKAGIDLAPVAGGRRSDFVDYKSAGVATYRGVK